LLIPQAHRQAVDLQLDHVIVIGLAQLLADPLVERPQFVGVVRVVHAQHGNAVTDGRELPQRPSRDALRGRVRRHQFRMLRFQRLEFREQLIVLRVRDLGLVADVVEVVVFADLPPEPVHSLDRFVHRVVPAIPRAPSIPYGRSNATTGPHCPGL